MASDVRYQILIDSRPDLELTGQISEIEVTESVRQPTTARVRFVADVCKADLHLLGDRRLQPGVDKLLSVLVSVDGVSTIISHGVIVDRTFELTEGGPGSWVEALTTDRRVQMDRESQAKGTRSGKVSSIVRPILQKYKFTPDVDVKEDPNYTPKQQTLNQPVTDLALVRALAGQTGVEFWIDYKLKGGRMVETAHFRASPRGSSGGPGLLPIKLPIASSTPELKLNSGIGNATLLGFNAKVAPEVPNKSGRVGRVDIDSARVETTVVPESTTKALGKKLEVKPIEAQVMSAGNLAEAQRRQTAALNDAAWTVRATADTSVRLACGLIRPHDTVKVSGVGKMYEGEYFVDSVRHSITQTDHKLHLELRRNAQGIRASVGAIGFGGF
jgi:hypothetical protein